MNFECKSTFKSKWKRFLIITLKIWAKIEVTKHVFMAKELYRIGLVRHLFFKCDKMSLRWVFSVKTAVILLKGIFESLFNEARSTLDRARWQKF